MLLQRVTSAAAVLAERMTATMKGIARLNEEWVGTGDQHGLSG